LGIFVETQRIASLLRLIKAAAINLFFYPFYLFVFYLFISLSFYLFIFLSGEALYRVAFIFLSFYRTSPCPLQRGIDTIFDF